MKKALLVIGVIALLLVAAVIALLLFLSKMPAVPEDYTETVQTGGELEAAYLAMGPHEVGYYESGSLNSFEKYEIYYPLDMAQSDPLPVVVFVNGTGVKGSKYPALQKHMASWGFLTIATEEEFAWNGFRLSISSGALRGRAREIWWDEFSFWDGSDINDNTYYSDTALFLRTGLEYSLRQFSIGLEYRADNLLQFTDESGKSSDRLRLSLSFSLNEFSIRGLIMKKNFASSAADLFDEDEWTDGSLLYALSIEKTFAHLHFSAAVYLSYDMQEDDHWLNASVRSSASPHIGFALMTGVSL